MSFWTQRRFVANLGGFTVKTQIPLNPPLLKGDFTTPLWKRGAGGIFHPRGCDIDGS